jgi:hypothetical protein
MSRKNNCKHPERSVSRYAFRLAKRGASPVSVRMRALADLRKIQTARLERTGYPWPGRAEVESEAE